MHDCNGDRGPAMTATILLASLAVILTASSGCARWMPQANESSGQLTLPALGAESVALEVTFVRIGAENKEFAESFWSEVDESTIAIPLRRRLTANGLRCGLLGATVPAVLQEVLTTQQSADPLRTMTDGQFGSDVISRTHRIRSQAGQAGKIVVRSGPLPQLAVLEYDERGQVHGLTLDQARLELEFTTTPLGDGRVNLELTPVAEHGQSRSRYVGREGNWAVDSGSRAEERWTALQIEMPLEAGQAVALTCAVPPRGIGRSFFAADDTERSARLLLLIRLQQTSADNRFQQSAESSAVMFDP